MPTASSKVKTICLTGGPGAGKTAVTDVLRLQYAGVIMVVPESASILYSGGFPRAQDDHEMRFVQRAIYSIQRSAEGVHQHRVGKHKAIVCDRGTLDGCAYWPSSRADYLKAVGSTLPKELARYDVVIHLESPGSINGYDHSNPIRIETASEARELDKRIAKVWDDHPKRYFVKSRNTFIEKLDEVIGILKTELPNCFDGGA